MSGMAEVLAAHAPNGVSGYGFEYVLCKCDRTNWMKAHEFPEHQLAALTAAGFGPVKEAEAAALEEAADAASTAAPNDPTNRAASEWLRARATKLRASIA